MALGLVEGISHVSYILDALKKAEQERQLRSKVPTPTTVQRVASAAPGRRLWPWIASGAVLVNGIVLIWLLSPAPIAFTAGRASSTQAPATPAPAVVPGPTAAARPPEPAAPNGTDATAVAPTSRANQASAPGQPAPRPGSTSAKPVEATPTVAPAPAPPAARVDVQRVKPAEPRGAPPTTAVKRPAIASVPPVAARAKGAVPDKVAAAPERPAAQAVPPPASARPPEPVVRPSPTSQGPPATGEDIIAKMKLQMLVYSDIPGERLVFINDRKYIEGSSIDGKLIVERITPEGAVLTHEGKRFLLRQ